MQIKNPLIFVKFCGKRLESRIVPFLVLKNKDHEISLPHTSDGNFHIFKSNICIARNTEVTVYELHLKIMK